MKNQNMLATTIGLQKTALVTTIEIISAMQQHGEDLLKTSLEETPWLPGSSKRACLDLTKFYSQYWESVRSATDQSFGVIEKIASLDRKTVSKEPTQTKAGEGVSGKRPAQKSPVVRKKTTQPQKTVRAKSVVREDKPVDKNVQVEKQVLLKKSVEKNPEQAKPAEVKAAKPIVRTSSPRQQKIHPVLDSKESKRKPSLPKKD